jgi:hypothetical protein
MSCVFLLCHKRLRFLCVDCLLVDRSSFARQVHAREREYAWFLIACANVHYFVSLVQMCIISYTLCECALFRIASTNLHDFLYLVRMCIISYTLCVITWSDAKAYIFTHMRIHKHIHIHMHIYTYTYTYSHMPKSFQDCTLHSLSQISIYMYIYIYIYIYIYKHANRLSRLHVTRSLPNFSRHPGQRLCQCRKSVLSSTAISKGMYVCMFSYLYILMYVILYVCMCMCMYRLCM